MAVNLRVRHVANTTVANNEGTGKCHWPWHSLLLQPLPLPVSLGQLRIFTVIDTDHDKGAGLPSAVHFTNNTLAGLPQGKTGRLSMIQ